MPRNYNDQPLITERLKELLKERGITQQNLAAAIERDKDYLNLCMRKRKANMQMLEKIGKYLDCNPLYLSDESVPYQVYGAYNSWNYDFDDCVRGLLYMMQYSPSDFTKEDISELKSIIGRVIDRYAITRNKVSFDMAFWSGESDSAGEAKIFFEKSSAKPEKKQSNTKKGGK